MCVRVCACVRVRACLCLSLSCYLRTEGVIRSLDPEFDMAASAVPYFLRYGEQTIATRFSGRFRAMLSGGK